MVFENQWSRSFRRPTERTERRVLVLWDEAYLGPGAAEKMLGVGDSVILGVVDSRTRLADCEMAECSVRQEFHGIETGRELRG